MTRSFLDRWHRPAGYHHSKAAGVPARFSKSAFSRLAGHFERKEAAQDQEFSDELLRAVAEARQIPVIEGEVGVRLASAADLPVEFSPLGTGFFRLGHSIWEMRADDNEGYRLVRKHEEIAVDMREESRTASVKEPEPGDVLFLRVANSTHPVILLSMPMDGMSSIMDMLGNSMEVPAEGLMDGAGSHVFGMDDLGHEHEWGEEGEEDEDEEEYEEEYGEYDDGDGEEDDEEDEGEVEEDEEDEEGFFGSIYNHEEYEGEDEDEGEEHDIEVKAPAVIRVKLTAAEADADEDDDAMSTSDETAFLDRILAGALPPPLDEPEAAAESEEEAELPKAASRRRRR